MLDKLVNEFRNKFEYQFLCIYNSCKLKDLMKEEKRSRNPYIYLMMRYLYKYSILKYL